jgi:hypothetical protein
MSNFTLSPAGVILAMKLAGLAAILVLLLWAGVAIVMWKRRSPRERERKRRLAVNLHGRMGDGTITDFQEDALYYNYSIRGVEYATAQDVSTLREFLPGDPALLFGPVTLKYSSKNPANSILLCEEWSGLRRSAPIGITDDCPVAAADAGR